MEVEGQAVSAYLVLPEFGSMTKPERLQQLKDVRMFTDDVLTSLGRKHKSFMLGGVRPKGLWSITDYCLSDDGSESIMVTIRKVAPGNHELGRYIIDRLIEEFPEVPMFEVNTEW